MAVSEGFKGWVAGFTDGDGNIGIHKQRPNIRQGLVHTAYYISVQFTNTEREALEVIRAVYRGQIQPRASEWGKYPVYHLTVAGNQGARLLRDTYPYLILKKEHARLCLDLVDTIWKFKCYGPRIPESEWRHRESLYHQLLDLNRRGKDRESVPVSLLEEQEFLGPPQPPLPFDDEGFFPLSDDQFRDLIKAILMEQENSSHDLAQEIGQGLVGKSHNIWDAIRVARLAPSLGVKRAIVLLLPQG